MPTFYDRFIECAERLPQNIALEIQRGNALESYSYAELRKMAESVGRWLQMQGLEPGSRPAEKAARQLLQHFPDHVPTLTALADRCTDKKKYTEALTLYQRRLKLTPSTVACGRR